ncbi:MAG TPA: S41 family peptidase [Trueperaceae bacterium]|nr:S41 family peptidase [Trueperaceae bacterium]
MLEPHAGHGEMIAQVFRALVRDKLLPSDPRVVAGAALRADGGSGAEEPEWFGADVERDAVWLVDVLAARPGGSSDGERPPWAALRAMVRAADKPHTGLVTREFQASLFARMTGARRTGPGMGWWRSPDAGGLVVAFVTEGGPAWLSGLRGGDLVVGIAGEATRPSGLETLALYAAEPGSSLKLDVLRVSDRISVDLTFRSEPIPSVTHRWLAGGVAYLDIEWFATVTVPGADGTASVGEDRGGSVAADTAVAVRAALRSFVAGGATGAVIDLRTGMGGSLTAVQGMLSTMTDADVVVAIAPPPGGEGEVQLLPRSDMKEWPDLPIAVLVNEQTTSAAEALALGLEELSGAALVGTPTSGGLNTLRSHALVDEYSLVLPDRVMLGPASRLPRPGYRLEPTVAVPNPSAADVRAGRDGQLMAALDWVKKRSGDAG